MDRFGLHIAHIEAAGTGTAVTLLPDVAALLVLLILIKTLGRANSQITVPQLQADFVLLEAGQVDVHLITVVPVSYTHLSHICVLSNAVMVKAALPEAEVLVDARLTASYDPVLHEKALDVLEGLQVTVTGR